MDIVGQVNSWKQEMETHLHDELLPFWLDRVWDSDWGGYLTQWDAEGKDSGVDEKSLLAHMCTVYSLMFRNYYAKLPDELLEAGMIDGLRLGGVFRKVVVPISLPTMVVVLIWQFTSVWNDFLFAVVLTQRPSIQPITVALQNLAGTQVIEWNVQMTGALIAAIPTLLVYIFLGKYFIQGLLSGSVKG